MLRIYLLALFLFGDHAQAAPIDELKAKTRMQGEVMVVGTNHLASIKTPLAGDVFAPLLNLLAAFKPTALAVETLRPEDINAMVHSGDAYGEILQTFVGETMLELAAEEQKSLGLASAAAIAEFYKLSIAEKITDGERLHLLRLAIAGYDRYNALYQWQLLSADADRASLAPTCVASWKNIATAIMKLTASRCLWRGVSAMPGSMLSMTTLARTSMVRYGTASCHLLTSRMQSSS